MRQSNLDELNNLISGVTAIIQSDTTTPQSSKDTICSVVMLIGILFKDIHRIADGIEQISEEI